MVSRRLLIIRHRDRSLARDEELAAPGLTLTFVDAAHVRADADACATADLLVVDACGDAAEAAALLSWLRARSLPAPTMAILPAEPAIDLLEAASKCADDFVLAPLRAREWRERVSRLIGPDGGDAAETTARDRLMETMALTQLVGRAPAFLRTIARIPLAARSGSPVLITGETGTGKELCARAVHHLGPRGRHPFIAVDCGALPDHLFENEVFGHARGAFTDARTDQKGLVMLAEGGTLFLDEVDALAPAAQSKLLRFLQERTFKPLGSDRFVRADVTVLAATNRDLSGLVRDKAFRADLYFRLNVLSLHLVPLRLRRPDIALLARHFVRARCAEQGMPCKTISAPALRALAVHDWPGNVRELYNVIQRAVVYCDGPVILPAHLAPAAEAEPLPDTARLSFRQARARAVAAFERDFVEELLRRHHGNITHAATEAQKDRRAFGRLVKKYGLSRPAS